MLQDDNGFMDYMTDEDYGEADPAWNGFYDKEVITPEPNYPKPQTLLSLTPTPPEPYQPQPLTPSYLSTITPYS